MVSFNPACYIPSAVSKVLPSAIACPPPPSTAYTIYDTLRSPFRSTFTVLGSGMDAILSLPYLSFLLIPTMTSYSTSLNLLFFYLTWSTLVLSHPPLRVEVVASLAVRTLFYILPSLLFLVFDVLIPGLAATFKTLGDTALPLRDLGRANTLRQAKLLAWSLANVLLTTALQALTEYTLTEILHKPSALKVSTTLPLPSAILRDLLRGLLLRDLLTHLIHRYLCHSRTRTHHTRLFSLPNTLTRLHDTWYHDGVPAPFPLSATYDHPAVYAVRVFLPLYLPAYLWRFHLLTYILYLTLVCLEDTFAHSGYAVLPTNFVLGGIARRFEGHCLSGGEGAFGTWGLADWAFGTGVAGGDEEELVEGGEEMMEQRKRTKGKTGKVGRMTVAEKGQRRGLIAAGDEAEDVDLEEASMTGGVLRGGRGRAKAKIRETLAPPRRGKDVQSAESRESGYVTGPGTGSASASGSRGGVVRTRRKSAAAPAPTPAPAPTSGGRRRTTRRQPTVETDYDYEE